MIEIEEQAKVIALKKFESLEELDKQIEAYLDTIYGSDSLVDKIYEDDSSIFYIDLFPWKDKIQFPFRNLTNYKEFINLGKRIIFYDVDYKWKEITNDENITDYIGWTPEDQLKLYLITMALTN